MATRRIRYLGQPAFELKAIKHPDTVRAEALMEKKVSELSFQEEEFLRDYKRNPKSVSYQREYQYDGKGEVLRRFPMNEKGELSPKIVLSKYKFMPPDYIGNVSEDEGRLLDGNDFGTSYVLYEGAEQVFIAPPKPEDSGWLKEKEEMQAAMAGLQNEIQGMKMRLGKVQKGGKDGEKQA